MGIHFGISQLISLLAVTLIREFTGGGVDLYYQYVVMLTGITGILTLIPAWILYQKDRSGRERCGIIASCDSSLYIGEIILLVLLGAALALYGNLLIGMLDFALDPTDYTDLMEKVEEGQSLFSLLLWMGVIAPVAEESIFRWLIFLRLRDYCKHAWTAALISGVMFGVYHGNVTQAVYASILGFLFAMFLEWTGNMWTSVLLHIGANVGSLLLSNVVAEQSDTLASAILLYLMAALLAVLIYGFIYFRKMSKDHTMRVI